MKIYYFAIGTTVLLILFFLVGFNFTLSSWVFTKSGLFSTTNSTLSLQMDTNALTSATGTGNPVSTPPSNASFIWLLVLMFLATGVVGAVAGLLTGINFTFIIKALWIMTPLVLMIGDWFTILNQAFTTGAFAWVYWLMFIVIAPLIFGYVIALSEFWEGRD